MRAPVRTRLLALLAVLGAALLLSVALAVPPRMVFDDADIDYTDEDIDTVFMTLEERDGEIAIVLTQEERPTSLHAITYTVTDLGEEDFFGEDIGSTFNDIPEFLLHTRGSAVNGYDCVHEDKRLSEVADRYQSAFRALGYSADWEDRPNLPNHRIAVFQKGDESVRVVLHQLGRDVEAHIEGV